MDVRLVGVHDLGGCGAALRGRGGCDGSGLELDGVRMVRRGEVGHRLVVCCWIVDEVVMLRRRLVVQIGGWVAHRR